MSFTTNERAEQLKKCCETIIENAEEIMKGFDLPTERTITIRFLPQKFPEITVEQSFLSKKMLDSMK